MQRRQTRNAALAAHLLEVDAGLVGEFAKVHLEGMARAGQHVDVGARRKYARLFAGDDQRPRARMLETDAGERVCQLDVDAEIVRVQLERVARTDSAVLFDVERELGDIAAVLGRKRQL